VPFKTKARGREKSSEERRKIDGKKECKRWVERIEKSEITFRLFSQQNLKQETIL